MSPYKPDSESIDKPGLSMTRFAILALGYYLMAVLTRLTAINPELNVAYWPNAGFAVWALLIWGYRYWPAVVLGDVAKNIVMYVILTTSGSLLADLLTTLLIALSSAVQALAIAWAINRFTKPEGLFSSPSQVIRFLMIISVGALVRPSLIVPVLYAFGRISPVAMPYFWSIRWLGNILGIMTVFPVLNHLEGRYRLKIEHFVAFEAILISLIFVGLCKSTFNMTPMRHLGRFEMTDSHLLLFIIYFAFRFGRIGTALGTFVYLVTGLTGTIHHLGPYNYLDMYHAVIVMQVISIVIGVIGLLISSSEKAGRMALEEVRIHKNTLDIKTRELESILDSQPDLYLWLDIHGKIIRKDGRFHRIRSAPLDEMLTLEDYISPEAAARLRTLVLKSCKSSTSQIDIFSSCKENVCLYLEFRLQPLSADQILVVIRDITSQKMGELILEENARRSGFEAEVGTVLTSCLKLRPMLGACTEIMRNHFQVDDVRIWTLLEGSATLEIQASSGVHPSLEDEFAHIPVGMYGIGRVALTRQPVFTNHHVHQEKLSPAQFEIKGNCHSFVGYPLQVDGRLVGVIGLYSSHDLKSSVVDTLASISNTMAIGIEREWAIEESRRAREESDLANRYKSEFLANMSHEIRTPLNGILGMTELLVDTPLEPNQREFLDAIRISGDSLLRIINDVLDAAKIDAGQMTLDPFDFCLRENLARMFKPISIQAHIKGLMVAYEVDPAVPEQLRCDWNRLSQVLVNLIGNAIKFTSKGEVVLSVNVVQSDASPGIRLQFRVRDSGIGIDGKNLNLVFQPFTQADGTMTRRFGGTGLGLSISNKLVQILGGELQLESQLGQGSTFHFVMDVEFAYEPKTPVPEVLPASWIDGLRALVVDNNPINQRILHEMLKSWNMKPAVAENGKEALRMVELASATIQPFKLILTDNDMPVMDGLELVKQLKNNGIKQKPPVIMLTSVENPEISRKCRELGVQTILTKPVLQSELLENILKVLAEDRKVNGGRVRFDVNATPAMPILIGGDSLPSLTILLAEDNIFNQRVIVTMLERAGHAVRVAENGEEAVKLYSEETFDMILMDIQMPVMDGLQATIAIRSNESGMDQRIPIIALTAHAMQGDRERFLSGGMDGYVTKPIRPKELWSVISQHVTMH
jgi:signal transduction histidine kinase/DNA-binding response OmpR family regulator/integral membrane sensor domain MASE1